MGDPELVAMCDAIRGRLVGSLTLYCGDRAVAEELAQDSLVRLWERWPDVRGMASPEAWTFAVGTNLARSWFRRRQAERRARARSGTPPDITEGEDVTSAVAVRAAVAALPERQRAVIIARFYLGLDVAGAATALGCAPGTVKAATHHALASLRRSGLVDVDDMEEVEA